MFCVTTQTELILGIAILARSLTPTPTALTDSLQTCSSWQHGRLGRHVGQLVYGYCSVSCYMLLFLRPENNVRG